MPSTRRLLFFSITRAPDASGLAHVEGAELHHMRTVLGLPVMRRVSLLDPAGNRTSLRIESLRTRPRRNRIIIIIVHRLLDHASFLAAASSKAPQMDFIVERRRASASELWPLVTARGLVLSPGAAAYRAMAPARTRRRQAIQSPYAMTWSRRSE